MFNDHILQRYMPGNIAKKVISDEGLYFRRIDCYPDDPSEGDREYFGNNERKIVELLSDEFPDEGGNPVNGKEISFRIMEKEKKLIFIQSWLWDKNMFRYMWDSYGEYTKSHDCALFAVNRFCLINYLSDALPVGFCFSPVKYVENKQAQWDPILTKDKKFANEKEFRISINISKLILLNEKILPEIYCPSRGSGKSLSYDIQKNLKNCGIAREEIFKYLDDFGFILKLPLPNLIENIYVPSNASPEFCAELDELLASKGHNIRCKRVNLPEA